MRFFFIFFKMSNSKAWSKYNHIAWRMDNKSCPFVQLWLATTVIFEIWQSKFELIHSSPSPFRATKKAIAILDRNTKIIDTKHRHFAIPFQEILQSFFCDGGSSNEDAVHSSKKLITSRTVVVFALLHVHVVRAFNI